MVLKKIAAISHEAVREIDIVGRLGGEEFVVLLPQTDKKQAVDIAERIRTAIAKANIKSETGTDILFTASFGVVTTESDAIEINKVNIDEMLVRADKAMYHAKESGRNKVCQD
jgi:diguanylate cyclase (GGDEF)-like protein